ncbi:MULTISPECIES: hypothetical protein [Phenylobacterium]|uniref:Pyocin large subunit-like protein n=1 Tax=Phenylobacterium koreense TaxID=266125 RepID=A0ABV2EI29_9CAUL
MARCKIALSLGLALILAACERPSAVARKDEPAAETPRSFASAAPSESSRRDREAAPVRELDGKPIWSASRRGTAEENARRAFERNGEAFGAKNLDDFIRKAHAFIEAPPQGTERLTRANGDVLFYDPKDNVFAVATRDGAPRTMFKPDEGAAYWQAQKDRENRRTARADDRESGGA